MLNINTVLLIIHGFTLNRYTSPFPFYRSSDTVINIWLVIWRSGYCPCLGFLYILFNLSYKWLLYYYGKTLLWWQCPFERICLKDLKSPSASHHCINDLFALGPLNPCNFPKSQAGSLVFMTKLRSCLSLCFGLTLLGQKDQPCN